MSRFNNPQTQPARAPLGQGQASPLEQDPQAWAAQTTAGRPAARPAQTQAPQQAFGNRPASPAYSQPLPGGYPQQPSPYAQGYGQPGGYGADPGSDDPFAALRADPPTQPPRQDYQYPQQADAFANGQYSLPQQPALSTYQPRPAAQQYDPYSQPAQTYAAQPAPQPAFGAASAYPTPQPDTAYAGFDTWSATHPQTDTRDYPAGFDTGYQQQSPRTQPPAGASAWVGQDHYAQLGMEPSFEGAPAYGQPAQPQAAGAFDQTYADDELEYEAEPPRRGWTRIAAILASTVLLGGGLTYAYTSLMGGGSPSGAPPVVKSAEGPSKVKPSDPGGKQFAHSESKVLGRLEGGASDTETGSTSSSSNVDSGGARKVPVLIVGRDGTIQPPAAPSDESGPAPARATVSSVPGLTVIDGFGGSPRPQPQKITTASEPPSRPLVVSPPAAQVKPKVIAAAAPTSLNDSTSDDGEPAPPVKKAPVKKVAAVSPPAAVGGPAPSGAGYVAVIASVPASDSSRIDALKQFADMQQKYGTILQNKTPDVQEANLGEKGTYHRLLVGPPGSRDSASQLCSDLKGQGYSNCWVTAY
jgi:hypothetical protein